MKVKIEELVEPVKFKPYTISITIEDAQEERILAELHNHHLQVGEKIGGYEPGRNLHHPSKSPSKTEISQFLSHAFKEPYRKVYA